MTKTQRCSKLPDGAVWIETSKSRKLKLRALNLLTEHRLKRERERECVCVCVSVCVRERKKEFEKERESDRKRVRKRGIGKYREVRICKDGHKGEREGEK